eukprot:g65754.t1
MSSHVDNKKRLLLLSCLGAAATAYIVWQLELLRKRRGSPHALASKLTKNEVFAMRRKYFCGSQTVSYSNTSPLMAVRAQGQYIYDEHGTRYLDTRNNVGHVGWQHPTVVAAVREQVGQFNSNTRYLHPLRVMLAQKLLERFPPELCKVFFVNSGSEANDLAIRLARCVTGKQDCIVVDRAYHGHTMAVLDISPYKRYEYKGSTGRAPHIHQVPCPDSYRGLYRTGDRAAAVKYASHVQQACDVAAKRTPGGGVAAFFIESGMSVAGVVVPPPGYLEECYKHVRAAGGICVADEVQVGFGRFGDHFWAFQQQGVVPDIVTMGKPFGNGFPLAAVVITKRVSDAFANLGIEYFNTFGGNPLACAAGLAVLDVIRTENLQSCAKAVGEFLRQKLRELAASEAGKLIGDVRGCGLFIGVEFVRDRETLEPATAETSILCSRLKDQHRILTSIDGEHSNVMVIKPPLCFSKDNAQLLVDKMRQELPTITQADIAAYRHTAT